MAFPRKTAYWRFPWMSPARSWAALVVVALMLMLIDFRFLWRQMDSTIHGDTATLPEQLRDGYGHSLINSLHIHHQQAAEDSAPKFDSGAEEDKDHEGVNEMVQLAQDSGLVGSEGGEDYGTRMEAVERGMLLEASAYQDPKEEAEDVLRYLKSLKLKPHKKWIVLDATSEKCAENLAAPSGWKILATGNSATLQGCRAPSCISLPPGLNLTRRQNGGAPTPETSSPIFRKNLAYLTALSHGAEYVLDANCSSPVKDAVRVLQFPPRIDHGPMYNASQLFNPYAHFGAWATGPRGVRGTARATPNSRMYFVRDFDGNVLVKHGVSDTSSDVSFLEGRGAPGGKTAGTRFDSSTPPVFLGQRSFSAAVPVCSLYRQNALWALLMPCKIPNLRCHLLRQLIQQRLFRELDAFSGFYQVKTNLGQAGPPRNDADLKSSRGTVNVEKLMSVLDVWMCKPHSRFFQCVEALSDYLLQQRQLSNAEHFHMKAWVRVLRKLGAVEPARVRSPWRGVRKTSEVHMTLGSMQERLESGGVKEERLMKKRFVDDLAVRCNFSRKDEWFPVVQWRKPVIEDIVLIIVFNWNIFFWNNLPFTETMHRPFYKHIFYCVPNVDELMVDDKDDLLRHVSFVEGLSDTWYFMYECVTIVARMNIQGVRGYLQIGDDTLTNSWKYLRAPRNNMWIPKGFTTIRADKLTHDWDWYWWPKSRGRPAILQAMADLEQTSGLTSEQLLKLDPNYSKLKSSKNPVTTFSEMYKAGKGAFPPMRPLLPGSELWETPTQEEAVKFMNYYYKANRMSGRVKHRALDFFYIPQVLIEEWVKFTRHFLQRNVLIELAVPAIHYGLAPKSEVKYLSASSVWRTDRNISYSFYGEDIFFLHPFKMKAHMEQKDSHDFFCNSYMSILFSELTKFVR